MDMCSRLADTDRIDEPPAVPEVTSERLARRWFALIRDGSFERLREMLHEDVSSSRGFGPGRPSRDAKQSRRSSRTSLRTAFTRQSPTATCRSTTSASSSKGECAGSTTSASFATIRQSGPWSSVTGSCCDSCRHEAHSRPRPCSPRRQATRPRRSPLAACEATLARVSDWWRRCRSSVFRTQAAERSDECSTSSSTERKSSMPCKPSVNARIASRKGGYPAVEGNSKGDKR